MALSPRMQDITDALLPIVNGADGKQTMAIVNQALGTRGGSSSERMLAGAVLAALAAQGQMVARGTVPAMREENGRRKQAIALLRATADLLQSTLD